MVDRTAPAGVCLHATCVSLASQGVLIMGPSGSGKSGLALQLIDQPGYGVSDTLMEAQLVSDDQVVLVPTPQGLFASPPESLAGLLEVRGLGIVRLQHVPDVRVVLVVRLVDDKQIERLPRASERIEEVAGIKLPAIVLSTVHVTAPAKVRAALFALLNDGILHG